MLEKFLRLRCDLCGAVSEDLREGVATLRHMDFFPTWFELPPTLNFDRKHFCGPCAGSLKAALHAWPHNPLEG